MQPKQTIFHIGYPKAASTTLQYNLFAEHPEINYLSFKTPKEKQNDFHTKKAKSFFYDLRVKNTIEYSFSNINQLFEENIKPFLDDKRINVFSDEGYLLPHLGDIGLTASRLKAIFGDLKIIIVIREQISLIESLYNMRPSNPLGINDSKNAFYSLEEWIEVNLNNLQWSIISTLKYFEVISWYIELFGKENVGIFVFENLLANPNKFTKDICDFLNIDFNKCQKHLSDPQNSYNRYNAMKLIPKYIPKSASLTAKKVFPNMLYKKISQSIYHLVNNIPINKEKLPLNSNYRSILNEFYRDSNIKIMNQFELEIDKYGYIT